MLHVISQTTSDCRTDCFDADKQTAGHSVIRPVSLVQWLWCCLAGWPAMRHVWLVLDMTGHDMRGQTAADVLQIIVGYWQQRSWTSKLCSFITQLVVTNHRTSWKCSRSAVSGQRSVGRAGHGSCYCVCSDDEQLMTRTRRSLTYRSAACTYGMLMRRTARNVRVDCFLCPSIVQF